MMISSIMEYVKLDKSVIYRNRVSLSWGAAINSIKKHVLPTLEEVIKVSKLPAIADSEIVARAMSLSKTRSTNPTSFFKEIKSLFLDIVKNADTVNDLIDKHLSKVVLPKTATVKDVAILRFITDISSMTLYFHDFCYIILNDEKGESGHSRKAIRDMKSGLVPFMSSFKIYSQGIGKYVEGLTKTPPINVKEDTSVSMLGISLRNSVSLVNLPMVSGFIGNPIYHVRLWLVDRDMRKYEQLQDKRQLIGLKILELRLLYDGKEDEGNRKEIEYYEDKLANIESDIRDIEDS